jgi:hypothetical protein
MSIQVQAVATKPIGLLYEFNRYKSRFWLAGTFAEQLRMRGDLAPCSQVPNDMPEQSWLDIKHGKSSPSECIKMHLTE